MEKAVVNTWFLALAFAFLNVGNSYGQLKTIGFEQLDSLQTVQKRPVLLFFHADWCTFCQSMKNTTFKNIALSEKLNNHFYIISFNAEQQENVVYKGKTFKFKPTGNRTGTHEIVDLFATAAITYPLIVILNRENEIIFEYSNYLNAAEMLKILEKLE